jgi:hypothetical protein
MKILILTSLFPPDTGAPAPYMKTLLPFLKEHTVTLLVHGYLPEQTTADIIHTLDKRWSKVRLMLASVWHLIKHGKAADLIIIANGPPTELPSLIASWFISTPITLCICDPLAVEHSQRGLYGMIHRMCTKRAHRIVTLPDDQTTYLKAELLPFETFDTRQEAVRQTWWKHHINTLLEI